MMTPRQQEMTWKEEFALDKELKQYFGLNVILVIVQQELE